MTTPDSNQTTTWTRWNTFASLLLSIIVLAGVYRVVEHSTSENGIHVAQATEGRFASVHTANIVDDIEDILEDILDILEGNQPKDPPGGE